MSIKRACFNCGKPIAECMGFVLGRDLIRLFSGERILPRELCDRCGFRMLLFEDMKPFLELTDLTEPLPLPM